MPVPYAEPAGSLPGVPYGGRGRVTISPATYAAAVGTGFGPGGRQGLQNVLASPPVANLVGPLAFPWAPGDALPPDWPDDPFDLGGWHFEFYSLSRTTIYSGDVATALSMVPAGVKLWTATGTGPTARTRPFALTWTPLQADQVVQPGDHLRVSLAQTRLPDMATAFGVAVGDGSCGAFVAMAKQAPVTVVGGLLEWCGADLLPPDWPAEDDLTAYHLEFRYTGPALALAQVPFSFFISGAWIGTGVGA